MSKVHKSAKNDTGKRDATTDAHDRAYNSGRDLVTLMSDADALVAEAEGRLRSLIAIFAIVDGRWTAGEVIGTAPEEREDFNIAASQLHEAMRALRREHAEVLSKMPNGAR